MICTYHTSAVVKLLHRQASEQRRLQWRGGVALVVVVWVGGWVGESGWMMGWVAERCTYGLLLMYSVSDLI